MERNITVEDLAKVFRSEIEHNEATPQTLKYIVYLRKSTEEKGKQIRSIPDQKKAVLVHTLKKC
jgi:hypothetical protein